MAFKNGGYLQECVFRSEPVFDIIVKTEWKSLCYTL